MSAWSFFMRASPLLSEHTQFSLLEVTEESQRIRPGRFPSDP